MLRIDPRLKTYLIIISVCFCQVNPDSDLFLLAERFGEIEDHFGMKNVLVCDLIIIFLFKRNLEGEKLIRYQSAFPRAL